MFDAKTLATPQRFNSCASIAIKQASRGLVRLLLLMATLHGGLTLAATTYNMTSTTVDVVNGDGICSLREALQSAATNATVNECVSAGGPYTINLQANATYTATNIGNVDPQFGNSAFLLNTSTQLTINGNGSTITQSGQQQRIFLSTAGNIILRNLTINGGNAVQTATPFGEWGAALLTAFLNTVVSLEDVTIAGNRAVLDGAAMYVGGSAGVNLNRVTLSDNEAATGSVSMNQIRVDQGAYLNMANSTMDGYARSLALTGVGTRLRASNVTIYSGIDFAIAAETGSIAEIQNSILKGTCAPLGGAYVMNRNASNSVSCSPTILIPGLEALSFNGGVTRTRLPTLPSNSKDAAPACTYLSGGTNPLFANLAPITTDQRGLARDANCDLGAVESMTLLPNSIPGGIFGIVYAGFTVTQTGGAAPATFAVTSSALPPGLTLNSSTGEVSGTLNAAGTYAFVITVTDANGFKSSLRFVLTIGKASQSIVFNPQSVTSRVFDPGSTFAINPVATTNSGLPIVYSSGSPTICTVAGTTVTVVSAGTCVLRASQAGDANYFAATVATQNVTITQGPQTLTFGAQANQTFAPGGIFTINPVATSSAGLSVSHGTLTPAVCTVAGTSVTMLAAGTCTLTADQPGNANYLAAPQMTSSVTIQSAAQTIGVPALPPKMLGDLPFVVSATGGASGNPVLFVSLTPAICTTAGVNGTQVTLLLSGTCTLRASQAGNANYLAAPNVDRSFFVGSGNSSVALETSLNPAPYRSPVTFTARITGVAPAGTVRFVDGSVTLCEAAVVSAVATCTVADLMEDAHAIRAYYLGDANNQGAFSAELVQTVTRVGNRKGAWWGGPADSGWGVSIMERGSTLVAGWYFYDAAGNPSWLTLNGCAWDGTGKRCSGPLVRSQSTWFGAYRADQFRNQVVGSATLAFDDQGGQFSYVVDGVSGSKRIVRLDLGSNPYAPFDYTDAWWGGVAENGWGASAHVAGQSLVGVWYTFDSAGQPTWFLFNNGQQRNPRTFQATLYRARGTPWFQPTNPAQYVATPVGEVFFDFDDVRHGTMTYQLDGVLQFKPFVRLPF